MLRISLNLPKWLWLVALSTVLATTFVGVKLIRHYMQFVVQHNMLEMHNFNTIIEELQLKPVNEGRVLALMGTPDRVITPEELIPLLRGDTCYGSFDSKCKKVLCYDIAYNEYSIAIPFVSPGPEDWYGYVGIDKSGKVCAWQLDLQ